MSFVNTALAEVVTGRAYIENGNISKAKADARKDAMRSFVEKEVGVKVNSTTEVVNFMLVRDSIVAKSDGFVLVKNVVDERQNGDIYEVTLELEANRNLIDTEGQSIASRLQLIEDDSSRSGIQVAIVDNDARKTAQWKSYFTGMLKQFGFRAEVNDDVLQYLGQHLQDTNDLMLNSEVRRIGRTGDRGGANAIIRGRVGLARKAEKITGGYYAVAQINAELIGYDNNMVDVAAGHYSYVAATPTEAEAMAKQTALRAAAETLGQQALMTNQREYQGGSHKLKVTLVFRGITNKQVQRPIIVNSLGSVNCRIVRSAFLPSGAFQAFVEATDYNNLEELKEAVLRDLGKSFYSLTEAIDAGNAGSTKLVFDLRG